MWRYQRGSRSLLDNLKGVGNKNKADQHGCSEPVEQVVEDEDDSHVPTDIEVGVFWNMKTHTLITHVWILRCKIYQIEDPIPHPDHGPSIAEDCLLFLSGYSGYITPGCPRPGYCSQVKPTSIYPIQKFHWQGLAKTGELTGSMTGHLPNSKP